MYDKPPRSVFGLRLRQARECAQLAQDRLGVLIGLDESCSSARISRYETGIHQPPFEVAEKIAEVLNIPTAYLYCRDDVLADLLLAMHPLDSATLATVHRAIKRRRV
jgi:transcriptional regulator with XRE-family HTH domain